LKYRVVEENERYVVQERESGETEWCELLDEEDNVLSFSELEQAKEFCEYLKNINAELNERKPNVVCEL
jgi:hypothetical protein